MKFWKFLMTFVLTIVSLKFIYQLPLFCGTPVYTFYSDKCNNEDITSQELSTRIDYIIGIHKFSGPASYPRNVGIFLGLFGDIFVLLALLLHKQFLNKIGAWDYIKTKDSVYKNPSFEIYNKDNTNEDADTRFKDEKLDLLGDVHS